MSIVATFLLNAALNFALGLVVARFLGPAEFGRYGVAFAAAVVVNTVLFEWLRVCATRFYSEAARTGQPAIRATLRAGYAGMGALLAALAGLLALARVDLGLPPALLLGAAGAALGMGLFDYAAALARARFLNRTYAALVVARAAGGFALMAGGAFLFGDAALVLAAAGVTAALAALAARRVLRDPAPLAGATLAQASAFAAYGLPLVAASVVYQGLPLINRGALAAAHGFAEAGYLALAADLGLRLFMALGSALDILLFQIAVRRAETGGQAEGERQVARNLAIVVGLTLPCAAGLWLVLPALEALLVPAAFRGAFAAHLALLIPGFVAFVLIQFALNPVFQIRRRTVPVVAAALVGVGVDGALLLTLPGRLGPLGFTAAQAGGLVAAALVLLVLALRGGSLRLPIRDLAVAAAASAVMTAALWPLRTLEAQGWGLVGSLALTAGGGLAIYGALAVLFDLAGLRRALAARLKPVRDPSRGAAA